MATSGNKSTPQFIVKLKKMIEVVHQFTQENPEIISFSDDGKQVLIHSYENFVNFLLLWNFRHCNWKSFVRQMNMYNFKKLSRGLKNYIFFNEYFSVGNEQNYHLIQRKQNFKQDSEEPSTSINILGSSLQKQYSSCSLFTFFKAIKQFQLQTDGICSEIKKKLQPLSILKKFEENRYILSKIRDSMQVMNQFSRKMGQGIEIEKKLMKKTSCQKVEIVGSIHKDGDKQQSENRVKSESERVKSGLDIFCVPRAISFSGIGLDDRQQKWEQKWGSKNKVESTDNNLKITPLCSFNSVTHLIDL